MKKVERPEVLELQEVFNQEAGIVIAENGKGLPFDIKRVYWLHHVPEGQVRGHHAHRSSKRIIVCVQGQLGIAIEDADGQKFDFTLDDPTKGLYIPNLHWGKFYFGKNTLMLCLASDGFNENDYIKDYKEFRRLNS